ncbi:hypothetical protein LTR96_011578 [Exophiala xenobiotica]|nr:hypothetical protein LTR72_012055 [Exophiala xenobiotica]KAK5262977.1 hypothetical protein LTR96_011578 [Exophiala xenobiotica]KAK5332111.1 hypothetical protein LTR98_011742 [Exophiala xenobiotica]KAK5457956.1 hypothetical protein LTR55_012009 [Exophiala xenobiotica]
MSDVSGGSSAEERAQAPEAPETPHTGDSEDSEYESNSQFSVDEDEVDEESDDEPDDDPDDKPEAESIERLPTRARDYALRRGSQTRTEKERSTSRRDKGASQPFEEKTGRAGTVQMVKRKRKIGTDDGRYGGAAQQLAWQTRRSNSKRKKMENEKNERGS